MPTTYTDEKVKSDVASALLVDPYVDQFEILLSVDDGIVHLNGEVNNYFEKYHAENVASSINGVYEVFNNIDVTGSDPVPYAFDYSYRYYYPYMTYDRDGFVSTRKDMEIKEDIERQFWWSPFVNLDEIELNIENGVATLSGKVDSWLQYDLAERNAYDGGAIAVDNNLIVQNK
jgi:osmotically-inducible protein OsmY